MGDINTNIRIDELEIFVNGLASAVNSLADSLDAIPSFYKMKDHTHGDTIEQSEFDEIVAAIDRGDIIRTGKLTRTGGQGYLYSENSMIISSRIEYDGTTPDIIHLYTTCSILDGVTASSRTEMLCDIKLEHRTNTVIQIFLMTQYPVVQS